MHKIVAPLKHGITYNLLAALQLNIAFHDTLCSIHMLLNPFQSACVAPQLLAFVRHAQRRYWNVAEGLAATRQEAATLVGAIASIQAQRQPLTHHHMST
jgi:hypothetical protein